MSKLPGDEVTVVTGEEVTGESVSVVWSEPMQFPLKDGDRKFLKLSSIILFPSDQTVQILIDF